MRKLLVLAFVLLMAVSFAQAQDDVSRPPYTLPNTETMVLSSPSNNQDYLIIVQLPLSYNTSQSTYPVLYLTDPIISMGTASEIVIHLNIGEELPEMIIVNVANPAYQQLGTDPLAFREILDLRSENFLADGRPDLYLEFLQDTLVPLIDTTYRTDPADGAIAGHTAGGDFALYALFHATDTFSRFLVSSPNEICVACEIENTSDLTARLYISSFEGGRTYVDQAFSLLEEANYEGLDMTKDIFEGQSHLSVWPFALSEGLRALYCDRRSTAFCLYRPTPVSNE